MSISVASIGFVLPTKPTAFAERGISSPITPIYIIKNLSKIEIKFVVKGCEILWEIEV